MKKLILTGLVGLGLMVGANASDVDNNSNIRVYGAGDKISDKSYNGAGMQFENDFSNVVIERGSDYTKSSAVLKYDITKNIYIKGGVGYLKREMLIEELLKDVTQKTGGGAIGYGNSKSYNVEVGYIVNDLSGAKNANGKAKTSYVEFVGLHEFGEFATFDLIGSYKNTNVFDKNYDDSLVELGYFPISDIRTFARYDSVNHDKDDYVVKAGIQYTFLNKKWSPFLRATTNTSENALVGIEYRENIINKSLKMRDVFENSVATSDIVAKRVAPKVFASKTAKPIIINKNAPVLSSTTQTFTTTVGTALTLVTVTALDDKDGVIEVIQSGDTVDFNTEGTYKVIYTATDLDGNVNSVNHTYVVGAVAISEPTISMANTSVNDEGGSSINPVGTPIVTNVSSGVVYSIVADPTSGMLTINSTTGAMNWEGDLFSDTNFNITIKVVNPDSGTQSTTFTLAVVDNG